jgi:uridine kinase
MTPPITHVIKRNGAVVPFNQERITHAIYRAAVAVGGRDRSIAERLSGQVVEILERTYPPGKIPSVEEIQDVVEKVLIENGHARTAKAYILYRDERSRLRMKKISRSDRDSGNTPYRKLWEVLCWTVDHDLYTVDQLNARIDAGELPDIVRQSDAAYEEDVAAAAELIHERRREVRIVVIAGPSSSGKTTTTIKLSRRLREMGLSLVALNIDNYFFDLILHPKDEFGDYDYETPQALDLPLINEHLRRLVAGEGVLLPFYDFRTGFRSTDVTPMQLGPNDIILIDSLHGLYGPMTESVPGECKFRLYIETLLQMKDARGRFIRWADLRLMRRMVRDAAFRAYSFHQTLEHWHYVRTSELRNIIANIGSADYIVNSALPYELPVMRRRLMGYCDEWLAKYRDDALREDAFIRATRVCELLSSIRPIEDESVIPSASLLREFIGGSQYEY